MIVVSSLQHELRNRCDSVIFVADCDVSSPTKDKRGQQHHGWIVLEGVRDPRMDSQFGCLSWTSICQSLFKLPDNDLGVSRSSFALHTVRLPALQQVQFVHCRHGYQREARFGGFEGSCS